MNSFKYISLKEAMNIHNKTIQYSGGGMNQCINPSTLDSVLNNIRNDDYYPRFADKITHLFFCVCKFHPFADGNKRLAITLSTQFLLQNGYLFVAKEFMQEMENISYHLAAGKIDKDLLRRIIVLIINDEYAFDEGIKIDIYNAIKDDL